MKLLLDECVWRGAQGALRQMEHDVVWIGELGEGLADEEVLRLANEQGRILVTLDKDFGKLSVLDRQTHCGIIRLVEVHPFEHATVIGSMVGQYTEQLLQGAIVVIKGPRVRLRRGPKFDSDQEQVD